ncbi:hypothetical protein Bca52824_068549 [Brassica carinata]|uniref:Uncharacterized protein n=1 Tax=Brassica carinata TaxID=52824 RepID=A0A8X7Q0Y9_BRACI|nr:hypothetical protein Bca52824_068549 [Brassica carinata]
MYGNLSSRVIVQFDENSGQPIGDSVVYSDHVQVLFDDPTMRKGYVMSALGSRCKDVKLRLWKEHKRNDLLQTLQNRPKDVPEEQWEHLVHMRKLRTLLNQNSHGTSNVTATLDDEFAQVFGPGVQGECSCVGRGPTPSKLVRRCTATRQEARAWAASFAVAFANIPNPSFANIPTPLNPNQEME